MQLKSLLPAIASLFLCASGAIAGSHDPIVIDKGEYDIDGQPTKITVTSYYHPDSLSLVNSRGGIVRFRVTTYYSPLINGNIRYSEGTWILSCETYRQKMLHQSDFSADSRLLFDYETTNPPSIVDKNSHLAILACYPFFNN
jgi:hypothetical protein